METCRKAALFLFFFSAISAELVTGSSPPLQFLVLSWLLFGYYGCGVLTVQELTVRWRKGWPTVMLLGMAYGIVEEGLTNLTFFNPDWATAGLYGRFAGVNWVWSVALTIVHGIISISIPILVTQLIFPEMKWQRLLGRRGFVAVPTAFVLIAVFQYFFIMASTHFSPDPGLWLATLGAMVALGYLGYRAPYHLFGRPTGAPRHGPRWFAMVGGAFTWGAFFSEFIMASVGAPFPVSMATWVGLALLATYVLERNLGTLGNDLHKLALVVGLDSFFLFLNLSVEFASPWARGAVAAFFIYMAFLLVWVRRRVLRRLPPPAAQPPPAPTASSVGGAVVPPELRR